MSEHYTGSWILIPELCIYQEGDPPKEGYYKIGVDGDSVCFSIKWVTSAGEARELTFDGRLGGFKHQVDLPGITHVSYTHVDDSTLDSTAFDGGRVVMYSRRVVSSDRELLAVSQVVHAPDADFSNFQVYRRVHR